MPEAKEVVPALMVLRKVPALSNRFTPPFQPMFNELCASNTAPGRLVITELFTICRLLVPVQSVVPALSRTRVSSVGELRVFRLSVAPGVITVRPLPDMFPRVQVI